MYFSLSREMTPAAVVVLKEAINYFFNTAFSRRFLHPNTEGNKLLLGRPEGTLKPKPASARRPQRGNDRNPKERDPL
jgi:hypothetical protein